VYFNSNEYHGGNFITEEALSAGYINGFVPRDPELLTKGINSLVDLQADQVLDSAENDLLRCLLQFPSTRESLQRIIATSNRSSGSKDQITWTSPDKLWLFRRLSSNDPVLIAFGKDNLIDFQAHLSSQQDALPGAISKPADPGTVGLTQQSHEIETLPPAGDNAETRIDEDGQVVQQKPVSDTQSQATISLQPGETDGETVVHRGRLDHLFDTTQSMEGTFVLPEDKVALRAQEAYYTMLWSSSIQKLSRKKQELAEMALQLPYTNKTTEDGNPIAGTGTYLNSSLLEDTIGLEAYQSLSADIHHASEQVQLLTGALEGLSSRLIQKALPADGWHSRKINSDYKELSARLSQHMNELEKWSVPESETIGDNEAYETMLELSQLEWGDLYEDDRMWSLDDVVQSRLPPATTNLAQAGVGDDESIDSFSERMEQEWGWLDEPTFDLTHQSEDHRPYEFDEHQWDEYLGTDS
jgi:hypothetical protein